MQGRLGFYVAQTQSPTTWTAFNTISGGATGTSPGADGAGWRRSSAAGIATTCSSASCTLTGVKAAYPRGGLATGYGFNPTPNVVLKVGSALRGPYTFYFDSWTIEWTDAASGAAKKLTYAFKAPKVRRWGSGGGAASKGRP